MRACLYIYKNKESVNKLKYSGSYYSTLFLMGPVNQVKKMFAKTRIIATITVMVMIVFTLVAGLVVSILLTYTN